MILYECRQQSGNRTQRWQGSLELKRRTPPYEMIVTARGSSFHILFGRYDFGNYLCIPNWDVGCELADIGDICWNCERLTRQLKKVDATSVVYALAAVKEHLEL